LAKNIFYIPIPIVDHLSLIRSDRDRQTSENKFLNFYFYILDHDHDHDQLIENIFNKNNTEPGLEPEPKIF
jgi:hypothetical protein